MDKSPEQLKNRNQKKGESPKEVKKFKEEKLQETQETVKENKQSKGKGKKQQKNEPCQFNSTTKILLAVLFAMLAYHFKEDLKKLYHTHVLKQEPSSGTTASHGTASSEITYDGDVVIGTDENFESIITKHECGHCKQIAPHFLKAATTLKNDPVPVILVNVDATEQKMLADKYEIKGYPTIKLFKKGVYNDYGGGREEADIVAWCRKKTGPAFAMLKSAAQITQFKKENPISVIYFSKTKSSKTFLAFQKVAENLEDVSYAWVDNESLFKENNVRTGKETLVLFKDFEELRNDLALEGAPADEEQIVEFINAHRYHTIMEFTNDAAKRIFGDQKPCLFLLLGDTEETDKAMEQLQIASKTLKGKILMSTSQVEKELGQKLGDFIGVTKDMTPTVRIVNPQDKDIKKYVFEGEITAANLIKFYNDFQDGKLKNILKSETIPTEQENAVFKVVGSSFEQVVRNPNVDVFVKYYAPWCGHCKSLAPIYEKLAKAFSTNKNIVIAHLDLTANEVPGLGVESFPTLIFYPKGNKQEGIKFEGERTLQAMTDFLKQNAQVEWVDLLVESEDL